ncbi:hypothetical protein QE152_g31132 [Popillia japonica]|uniref:Integrase catalytic domain-containing protein n=1 Tax=Popillia japonica TaxID=7064 RepID=A0AAW1JCA1_POPJA
MHSETISNTLRAGIKIKKPEKTACEVFLSRHTNLAPRTPESTSVARPKGFNRHEPAKPTTTRKRKLQRSIILTSTPVKEEQRQKFEKAKTTVTKTLEISAKKTKKTAKENRNNKKINKFNDIRTILLSGPNTRAFAKPLRPPSFKWYRRRSYTVLELRRFVYDNDPQFTSHKFRTAANDWGVEIRFTAPYSPQQNPVERANRV